MIAPPPPVAVLSAQLQSRWDEYFSLPEITSRGLRVLAAIFVGWLAFRALHALLQRIETSVVKGDDAAVGAAQQRARTLLSLVRSVGLVVISVLVLFMVLGALGVDLGPLLAGAGVVGLAISFGAQSLVKDVISGIFILLENQFGVGDVIRLDTAVSGTVERMTLRIVVLRDVFGVVHIVPNGQINRVSNLTRTWSRAVVDVGVGYDADLDRVMEVLRDEGRQLAEDEQWKPLIIEGVEVPGVEALADSAVTIRVMAKTIPLKQWDVARELRRRIKRRFDAEGIEIPFPQRTVTLATGAEAGMFTPQPAPAPQPRA